MTTYDCQPISSFKCALKLCQIYSCENTELSSSSFWKKARNQSGWYIILNSHIEYAFCLSVISQFVWISFIQALLITIKGWNQKLTFISSRQINLKALQWVVLTCCVWTWHLGSVRIQKCSRRTVSQYLNVTATKGITFWSRRRETGNIEGVDADRYDRILRTWDSWQRRPSETTHCALAGNNLGNYNTLILNESVEMFDLRSSLHIQQCFCC